MPAYGYQSKVAAFLAAHPEYSVEGVEQPGQGATNSVVFARRDNALVVMKVFCETERKAREGFGLHHWHETGLVPTLLWEDDPSMIVMSHLPGYYLHQA